MAIMLDMPNLATESGKTYTYLYPPLRNGIMEFSSNYYKTWINKIPDNITSLEFNFKFATGSDVTNWHALVGQKGSSNYMTPQIDIEAGYAYFITALDNTNSWAGWLQAPIKVNTAYTINCKFENGKISGVLTEEGESPVTMTIYSGKTDTVASVRWADYIAIGTDQSTDYFNGKIDLKSSYIKINNELWWTGLTEVDVSSLFAQPYEAIGGTTQI